MSSARQHFEHLYQGSPDPWGVASHWYERRKRDLMLASLPRERYRHGFEPGCGNGETTARLLERCEQLCAVDFSAAATRLCDARVPRAHRHRLDLRSLPLPDGWPEVPIGGFDLIVVSELAYYFDDAALASFLHRCMQSLCAGGHLLMCHWRHDAPDRQQPTAALHHRASQRPELRHVLNHGEIDFQLDVWESKPLKGDS